jgi:Ankyrin repeats (3 copies)
VNAATAIRNCFKLGSDAAAMDSIGHSAIWHLCDQSRGVAQENNIADVTESAVHLLKAGCPLFSARFTPTEARVSHRAHTSLGDPGSEWGNMASREGSAAFFKGIATHLSSHDSWRAVLSSISCHTDVGVLMFRALMAGGAAGRMLLEPELDITTPEGRDTMRTLDPYREPLPAKTIAPVESRRRVTERRPSIIDLTGCSFGGFTVGGWAVRLGGVHVVEHILSCGYNPTQSADIFGNSMVHLAAKYGTEGMVDAVCSPRRYVIHLEAPNSYGFTAAMEGARSGNVKGVKRLISYGASARRALDGRYCAWLLSLIAAQDKEVRNNRDQDLSNTLDKTDAAYGETSFKNIKLAKSRFLVHNTFDLDILRKKTRLLLSSGNSALLAVE